MRVLVLNCGSSSIKYELMDMDNGKSLARGTIAKIGEHGSYIEHESGNTKIRNEVKVANHEAGFKIMMSHLMAGKGRVIKDASEVSAVGHRVVHGGEGFSDSILIDDGVIRKIRECIPLAPLHNPHNLAGIEAARKYFPKIPHVAVFDTAFHQTLPQKAFTYPIPYEMYEKFRVRRYGFHGTSCRYVSARAAELLGRPIDSLRMVVCHLGNGVTLDAIRNGKSVETSMGLTPTEGLMMGTRSGDVDPGVVYYLSTAAGLSLERIYDILNRESGLLGVSGVSNDMREVIEQAKKGNPRCKLAVEMFAHRLKKYVGAYAAVLGGIDALVFTAGIGVNSPLIREKACSGLSFMGLELDRAKNRAAIGREADISGSDSRVRVLVIPTDEEKMIALDTVEVARGLGKKAPSDALGSKTRRRA
ncbi:MAG TPA: acetate kinase [Nitrososphaerales archaeon]|nr:acetate kinase [Nitrososphaerales archaeon]